MANEAITAEQSGQTGTPAAVPSTAETANQQAQQPINYVTSDQLNAALADLKKSFQSTTDKSYARVSKMIQSLKDAGIQNPTEEQARAMIRQQDNESANQSTEREAQQTQQSDSNPDTAEAENWIKSVNGDPSKPVWHDIYDLSKEWGVNMIGADDPELKEYFRDENGQVKSFESEKQFYRAFDRAFEAKANRLKANQPKTMASSPAMVSGGSRSNYRDPKAKAVDLISNGLR